MSVPKSRRSKSKVEFEMTYFKLADGLDNLHRAAVNALTTVAEVEAYDYTTGYPEKINFDTYE